MMSVKSFVSTPMYGPPRGIEAHDSEVRALAQSSSTLNQWWEVSSDRGLPERAHERGIGYELKAASSLGTARWLSIST
jgi:hypothetical protein